MLDTDISLTAAAILGVLLLNEHLWRRKILRGEVARKLIHILIGVWGAFWPFYMTWEQIALLGLMATGFMALTRMTSYLKSVHDVRRKTLGDVLGPASITLLALLEPSVWVYTAAVLHIALADGLAAVAGARFGQKTQYRIIGNTKSLVGTGVFLSVSFGILVAGAVLSQGDLQGITLPLLIWVSIGATYLENVSPYGFDNLLVPALIYVVLEPLQLAG